MPRRRSPNYWHSKPLAHAQLYAKTKTKPNAADVDASNTKYSMYIVLLHCSKKTPN